MDRNIAVLGTGAIGSSIGADLTIAGHNVILIDQWPAHVETMKSDGLRITMPEKELHTPVQAFHLYEVSALRPKLDMVFLCTKSYDTCWMTEFIKPYLKPDGVLVSVQNSLNDEWIAPIIGYGRDIGCAFALSAELFQPGLVTRRTDHNTTSFTLGELHGRITSRLTEVAGILSAAGKTETTTNIWGTKWSKLVFNTMTPFDAIAGISGAEIVDNPEVSGYSIKLGRESMKVGKALGYNMEPIFGLSAEDFLVSTDEVLVKILRGFFSVVRGKGRSHALQDLSKGRRTEIDYLNGLVAKKGREAGIATPLNEAVTFLVRQIEEGIRKPDKSNLEILKRCRLKEE